METFGFLISVSVAALYAAINKIDEGLLRFLSKENEGREEGGNPVITLTIFSSVSAIIMIAILGAIGGKTVVSSVTARQAAGLMAVGFVTILSIVLYLHALQEEEAATVIPVFQTIPVFGYILGWIMLKETLAGEQVVAGIVIIIAAAWLSVEFGEKQKFKLKPFLLMIGSSALCAFADTLFRKLALEGTGFVASSFWRFAGYLSIGPVLCLVPKCRAEFKGMAWKNKSFLAINLGGEGAYLIGELVVNSALLLAPVSIVLLGLSFQPAWVLFFSLVLAKCWPKLYGGKKERQGSALFFQRAGAIAIMIIASYWV